MQLRAWLTSLVFVVACRAADPQTHHPPLTEGTQPSYLERRAAHKTELREEAPSPNRWEPVDPPQGVERITYPSDGRMLWAWLARPSDAERPAPALVYLHNDFSFDPDNFEACRPFLEAGFAVMTPTYRGEHGNPGRFELLYGEVDDAVASIRWLADQPGIDAEHIYVIGHSAGGGVAAMVSLHPEAPVRLTASIGGIYVPETFGRWASGPNARLIRFDATDRDETELRTLGPNVAHMVHPHLAYIGDRDRWFVKNGARVADAARRSGSPFQVISVPGTHMGSRSPALADFLARLQADVAGR